jgi:hypothetical protein
MATLLWLFLGLATNQAPTAPAAKEKTEEREAWKAAAARCGEEILWASDWESASERARAEAKPVLAVAWMYEGFEITDGSRSGFGMDEDVIALVNARFVPLALHKDTDVPLASHEVYGLSPTSLGAALLVVAPDGQVLADSATLHSQAACEFLRAFLAKNPEYRGEKAPAGLGREARAERHLARGELAEAARVLAEVSSPRAHRLAARLASQQRDTERALAELRAAREGADEALAAEVEREELLLVLSLGRESEARALAERLVSARPEHESAAAARYALGLLDQVAGEPARARERWGALVAERPESRWAWLAAVCLLAEPAELQLGLDLAAPSPALLDHVAPVPFERADASESRKGALHWLRTRQTAAGGFPDPTELEGNPRWRNDISLAIDALAARALLAAGDGEAAERAELALRAERARAETWKGREAMAYGSWADSLGLELVVELLAAKRGDAAALRAQGEALAGDLVGRQRQNGGWSYFYSTSMAEDAVTLEQSISFVTATAVRALLHARAAGIEIDEDALEQGLACLMAMRDADGVFVYMLWSFQKAAEKEPALAGAAGRGPLCELALLEAGQSDEKRLGTALERFFEHLPPLAAERGKALMHCGAEGQGCHYVLYDYATAAQAIAALPRSERKSFQSRLRERVLDCRRADGAFLDAPVLGPTPGTALALLALVELDGAR